MRKKIKMATAYGEMILVEMEEIGAYVSLVGETLYIAPMISNGSPDISALGELTAPNQETLNLINKEFDKDFLIEEFSGR